MPAQKWVNGIAARVLSGSMIADLVCKAEDEGQETRNLTIIFLTAGIEVIVQVCTLTEI